LDGVIGELRRLRDAHGGQLLKERRLPSRTESNTVDASPPSCVLTDPHSSSTRPDGHFYLAAARIGLQAAEALAYAHQQRVLHRDIKPSNLLLDARGTVWVTDFGLAKEEGDDVTRSGNIVGTIRYMAPERFNGVSDVASDVYGLGLTLYELLTLSPAFPQSERAQLMRAIMQQEPIDPRRLDPYIPRDLETIVLKAISKEPAGRYSSAQEMADDLRRFLADLPLQTRRISAWERTRRWCRRNPGWAATIAGAISLLLVVAVGGSLLSVHLGGALSDLRASREQEIEKLWQSHLERARALRTSGRIGQRFRALEAIREAAKIKVTPDLSDEAVAALVLPDIEIAREWEGCPEDTLFLTHDAAFQRYARVDTKGEVTVCRVWDESEVVIARMDGPGKGIVKGLWMSPNGRYIVLARRSPAEDGKGRVTIWRLDGSRVTVWRELDDGLSLYSISFHADGRRLAIGHYNGTISVLDLEVGGPPRLLTIGSTLRNLAFHPHDNRLAVASNSSIRLIDVVTGQQVSKLPTQTTQSSFYGLAWRPDGKVLAVAPSGLTIHFWDVATGTEIITPLEGHGTSGISMAFNHRGDRLLSNSWDGLTRLWDAVSGDLLLTMPGVFGTAFSPDDSTIGMQRIGTKLRLWRVADGRELRRIHRPLAPRTTSLFGPVLSSDQQVLAAGSNHGLVFFNLQSGRELGFVAFDNAAGVATPRHFDATGGWLTAGGIAAAWPTARDPDDPGVLRVGPPRRIASALHSGLDASANGRVLAIPRGDHALVIDQDRSGARVVLRPHHDVRHCAVSPDGNRVATCSWTSNGKFTGIRVWDARTGKHLTDLPVMAPVLATFSRDGRWLATVSEYVRSQIWETSTWQPVSRIKGEFACWDHQGRWVAVFEPVGEIRVVEPDTQKVMLRLVGPEATSYVPAFFTPDGSQLVTTVSGHSRLYVWDLRLIGKQVRELGLDWNWPDPIATAPSQPVAPIRSVEVIRGRWPPPPAPETQSVEKSIRALGRRLVHVWQIILAPARTEPPN
jgi:WD40 repeat protein